MKTEKTKQIEKIAKNAIAIMNNKITNEIFLIIQNDSGLMHEYLRTIEDGSLDYTNQIIGKEIKKYYHLTNEGREKKPSCTLIQSHQKYKKPS